MVVKVLLGLKRFLREVDVKVLLGLKRFKIGGCEGIVGIEEV